MERSHLGSREFLRAGVDAMAFSMLTGFELLRSSLVNRKYSISKAFQEAPQPLLDPDSSAFYILSQSGDFFDGFVHSMLAYNVLTAVDMIQARVTHRPLGHRMRLGISTIASAGSVVAQETGHLFAGGTNVVEDIPAGIVGVIAYIGVNRFGRTIAQRMPEPGGLDPKTRA